MGARRLRSILRGERRVIDRVDLTYRVTLGMNLIKGPATVCVFGR